VKVDIHWAGGLISKLEMIRPVARMEQLSYYGGLTQRIRQLAGQGLKAAQITQVLNQEGWRPPKRGEQFGREGVITLMNRLGLTRRYSRSQDQNGPGKDEWWISQLSRALNIPVTTLYSWARRGWVKARQNEDQSGRWVIWADQQEMERLRKLRNKSWGHRTRHHWIKKANMKESR
ncbi:MAG: recombinase family protein, partial [bacterium]|nr:recombinase family protein [bacterium]